MQNKNLNKFYKIKFFIINEITYNKLTLKNDF
jgi:hypothetical protein